MARTESDRAVDVMEGIVSAGWRLAIDDYQIRRLAQIAIALLLGIAGCSIALFDGGLPPPVAFAAVLAPSLVAALVVCGLRAAVLDVAGSDRRVARFDLLDVVMRGAGRAPEVLAAAFRVVRRPAVRSRLAPAIVVVNGVGADEAVRTSRALLGHAFGDAPTVNVGFVFAAFILAPVTLFDVVVAWLWPLLSYARFPVLLLAVLATVVAVVATVAVDGAVRGRLLRVARGDRRALPAELLARVVDRAAIA